MMTEPYIFLAGASRGVGREIAKYLQKEQMKVKVILRSSETRDELEAMGIQVVMGDALDITAVELAMQNQPISVVISTIGGLPKDGERADYLGNKNLIDAAVNAGVQKFILVSSIGSGNSVLALSTKALETFRPVLLEKEKAEKHLIESGLIYTIIRPGVLKSEPATGNGVLSENYQVRGIIHRADVAQLVGRCVVSNLANNKIFSAVDKNMLFGNITVDEFSLNG